MKQIIIEIEHLTTSHVFSSMPLDIDDEYEAEMMAKAKEGIEAVLGSGGRLTLQTAEDAYTMLPPDLIKQCAIHIMLLDSGILSGDVT